MSRASAGFGGIALSIGLLSIVALLLACGGARTTPARGDREALQKTCATAREVCNAKCGGDLECSPACSGGFSSCSDNIRGDDPREWQPSDAFYDGCLDECSECEEACAAAQLSAARGSAAILQKYGTMVFTD